MKIFWSFSSLVRAVLWLTAIAFVVGVALATP